MKDAIYRPIPLLGSLYHSPHILFFTYVSFLLHLSLSYFFLPISLLLPFSPPLPTHYYHLRLLLSLQILFYLSPYPSSPSYNQVHSSFLYPSYFSCLLLFLSLSLIPPHVPPLS